MIGWRSSTIDIDIRLDPEPPGIFGAIAKIKQELNINIELASPQDFLPTMVDEILKIAKKYDLDAAEVDEILRIAKRYRLDITSADELYRLLKDLGPLGFTRSTQLSDYIRINQLGSRYPNISGIVTMNNGGRAWEFTGGFSREVYRIICQELGLANQGTSAIATDFESFQDIYSRNQK